MRQHWAMSRFSGNIKSITSMKCTSNKTIQDDTHLPFIESSNVICIAAGKPCLVAYLSNGQKRPFISVKSTLIVTHLKLFILGYNN